MATSSARPDYLQRYASLVADRSTVTRSACTRATLALSLYRSSCPDVPVTVAAPKVSDGALARCDVMVAGVRRVAAAFVLADRSDPSDRRVVVVDDAQFGRFMPGAITAIGEDDHGPEVIHRWGWRRTDEGTHTVGPADLAGDYEVVAGTEVTRTSFFDLDKDGLNAALGYGAFAGARATADGTLDAGALQGRGHAEATVGIEASAQANAKVTLEEVHVDVTGGAFAGARAAADAELEALGVEARAGVEGRAGIGADFEAEADFSWDKVGFDVSWGFALGLGAGGGGELSVDPRKTATDAVELGTRLSGDAATASRAVRAEAEDLIVDGSELVGSAYDKGRDAFDDGLDFVRDPLGNTGAVSLDFGQLAEQIGR